MPGENASSDLSYFKDMPLVAPTLEDSSFEEIAISRTLTFGGLGHSLMAGTWKSPDTISHLVSFYRPKSNNCDAEVRRFYTFGNGLNSHPHILHGGVLSTVLDSTMSNTSGLIVRDSGFASSSVVTAQLNVSFQKPVRTPGTVMVRCWLKKLDNDGRKIWVEAVVEGGDKGEICHAKAEGLWIRIKASSVSL